MRADLAPRLARPVPFALPWVLVAAAVLFACTESAPPPPAESPETVTAVLGGWTESGDVLKTTLARFTRETGISVRLVPFARGKRARLERYQDWLDGRQKVPDVYHADVTEIPRLAASMIDLRPYLADEAAQRIPAVMSNYVLGGRLVAMPLYADVGVLLYRTDLLKEYGYAAPPVTWDELTTMAARIQAGERAKGNPDFWGFTWPGSAGDDLLCVALEVQASFGGGQIIETNQTISVNNPRAAHAVQTLRHWVGTISPPGTASFGPHDARNLWFSGNAAFLRSWPSAWSISQEASSAIRGKVGVARVPSGGAGHFSTLGGWQLSVSKFSPHPKQAAELVRFLTSRDQQRERALALASLPPSPEVYDDPVVLAANPFFRDMKPVLSGGTVARPAWLPGKTYDEVTNAYVEAVHAVLTGKTAAPLALADLEKRLVAVTGFPPGPPLAAAQTTEGERAR